MLQPRICLLGLLPFRPIIRIGCRPIPAECGLDRPAARARLIAGVRITRLHGSAILGSVRLSLERGDLEPGPVGAPGTSNGLSGCLVSPPTPMGQQRCADQPDLKFAPRTAPGQTRKSNWPTPSSALPRRAEVRRTVWGVRSVPTCDIERAA